MPSQTGKSSSNCAFSMLGPTFFNYVILFQIIVCFQESSVHFGNIEKNSARFCRRFKKPDGTGETATLISVKLTCGNAEIDGLFEPKPDKQYSLNYFKWFLLNDCLTGGKNLPPALEPERFVNDQHFYYFTLDTSMNTSPEWTKSPLKSGPMRMYVQFNKATPTPITMYCFIISDACIVLDKGGRVTKVDVLNINYFAFF